MTQYLKQSTAATIIVGPFVDATDGVTAETALTISQADIRLSKNGAAFAQTNNAAGATHMENGYYSVPLDTTDSNTLGTLRVAVNESGAAPVWRDFAVLSARAYAAQVEGATFNERGGRVWYVAASGGSSSNDGTYSQPLDSFANAVSAASPGDDIVLKAGSYATTAALDCTKMNIRIRGEGVNTTGGTKVTLTTAASFTKVISLSSGCSVSDMWLVCADKGMGVGATGRHNVTAERLRIDGHEDMVAFSQCHGVTVRDIRGSTDWDGITINGAGSEGAAVIENCSVVGDCSASEATGQFRGLYLDYSSAIVRNCHVSMTQSAVNNLDVLGVSVAQGATTYGGVTLEGSTITVDVVAGTGEAIGVNDNSAAKVQIIGGAINVSGTAGSYDIRLEHANSRAKLINVTGVSSAKCSGAVQVVDEDVSDTKTRALLGIPAVAPAANGGLPTVNASNQVAGVSGDVLGSVGAVSGDVEGNVVGDVEGNVQGSVNSISGVTFPANFAALAINASGHVSRVTLADTVTTLTEEVGGGSATDINIESIPTSRVFVLVPTASGLRCETRKQVIAGAPGPTYAVDFRNDAAANQKIFSVDIPSIVTGTPGGVTFGAAGREGTQAKFTITGVTAGDYVIRVTGRYGSSVGPAFRGDILVRVVE